MIKLILNYVAVVALVLIGAVFGLIWKVKRDSLEARAFDAWLRKTVAGDPRYERLVFEGASWSGPGHPVYISITGTVPSQVEWLALSNLVYQANPPVTVSLLAILLEKEQALAGYLF